MNAVTLEDPAFWTDFVDLEILMVHLAGPIDKKKVGGTFMKIISITSDLTIFIK
jgi:hypothetical protein